MSPVGSNSMAAAVGIANFATAAQGLLDDARFFDFTVVCGWKEFKVHRCILASHSKWFEKCCSSGFSEAANQRTELKEDNLSAIEVMIHYFYNFDYDDTVPHGDSSNMESSLELNTWVYAVADKYNVPGLKVLALEKFKAHLKTCYQDHRIMVAAVRTLYNVIPANQNDNHFHELLLGAWIIGGRRILGEEGCDSDVYVDLIRDVPLFAVDLTKRLFDDMNTAVWVRLSCETCGATEDVFAFMVMRAQKTIKCERCDGKMVHDEDDETLLAVNVPARVEKFW